MDKELIDRTWACLPREFREEVKKEYRKGYVCETLAMLGTLFGIDNLTSDAEGEDEMLCVSRKNVQKMYSYNEEELTKDPTNKGALLLKLRLDALFGSKCLPDEGTDCTPVEVGVAENTTTSNVGSPEPNVDSSHGNVERLEPKPAEPKFTKGDIVHCKSFGYEGDYKVLEYTGGPRNCYDCIDKYGAYYRFYESDLEPLTEQEVKRHVSVKEACEILGVDESEATKLVKSEPIETCTETCTDDCSSPDHFVVKHEMVDKIIKDGFKNHNRLHIAAMAMEGLLANEGVSCFTDVQDLEHMDFITYHAFEYADKLIKKSEEENDI